MPNTYLDARANYPGQTGPTRDWHAIAATEPVYRQEPWQIQANRLPVNLVMKSTRPQTQVKQDPAINLQRIPVTVRSSNQRPVEAGLGPQSSTWRVSDPAWSDAQQNALAGLPGHLSGPVGIQGPGDNGAGCTAGMGSLSAMPMPVLALLGAALGFVAFKYGKGRK